MRAPKKANTTDQVTPVHYNVADPDATEIAGIKITEEHRKNGIMLPAAQALSYVASGTLTTEDKGESTIAKDAVKDRQAASQASTGTTADSTTKA